MKIVQNEGVSFVEYSGFVNLDEECSFLQGLFIDIFAKNCILITVIVCMQKDKELKLFYRMAQMLYKKRSTPLFHAHGHDFFPALTGVRP